MEEQPDVAILTRSCDDVREDLDTLFHLAREGEESLLRFQAQLIEKPNIFRETTRQMLLSMLESPLAAYARVRERLGSAGRTAGNVQDECKELIALKKRTHDELRSLYGISSGLIVSADWQASSYAHSLVPRAGRQTGKIIAMVSDYKQDHHPDAEAYEQAFRREYIDAPFYTFAEAFAVASGMSAFLTAASALRQEVGVSDVVFSGQASYFENKKVLRGLFGSHIRWLDEMNVEYFVEAVLREQPRIIFLDTLGNAESVSMPDLAHLIPAIARVIKKPTYLVLDNTGLSVSFQPLRYASALSKIHLVVVESLNKYHQFGFDRVTGGIVWGTGMMTGKLFSTRMHGGTNISDASILSIPRPTRKLFARRLARFHRNAHMLAEALDAHITSRTRSPLSHVVYPGLPSYAGFQWTRDADFHGCFFVLKFKPTHSHFRMYQDFVKRVMGAAQKRGVDLIAGTSFGFDVTRIYITARNAQGDATPFVRVAVGTESRWEIERLKEVFIQAINEISR